MQTFTEFLYEMEVPQAPSAGLDSGVWANQYKQGNAENMVNEGADSLMAYLQEIIEPAKEAVYTKLIERFDQIGEYEQGVKFARFMLQMELERALQRR